MITIKVQHIGELLEIVICRMKQQENEDVRDPEVFQSKVYLFMDIQKRLWMQTFS